MRILVDIDETLNNLVETILPLYNEKYRDNITIDNITDYNIHKFLKPECKDIFKEFMTAELIENLQANEGAVEALTELSSSNRIYFLTAAHPASVLPKHKWLKQHFPFYTSDKLIICHNKDMVKGTAIIDDCTRYLKESHCPIKICYRKPWNTELYKSETGTEIALSSWGEIKDFVLNLRTVSML